MRPWIRHAPNHAYATSHLTTCVGLRLAGDELLRKLLPKENRRLDSCESRDARAALPQNCSIHKVLWQADLGNSTKVLANSP